MCRDRHPEIFWKSGQIWQNYQSWRGEIRQFGFSQGPGGSGIHPGGFVLMSGPQKPNYFLIWAIWGSVRAYFLILFNYLGVPPGFPIGPYWPYWLLLAAENSKKGVVLLVPDGMTCAGGAVSPEDAAIYW